MKPTIVFDKVNSRVVTEDDTTNVFYTNDFGKDKDTYCEDKVVENVVGMYNEGKTLMEIDEYLLDEGECTQDAREIIVESLYLLFYPKYVVKYKDNEYRIRTFIVIEDDGAETQRTIATQSLSDAMGEDKEVWDTKANDIDCQIYYYVEDEQIDLSPEDICQFYLDMPMKFVDEIVAYIE
jgi:hypothetical protein